MTTIKKILIGSLALLLYTPNAGAQCNSFTKRVCLPELSPYFSNGQLHTTLLKEDNNAVVKLSLSKGLSYRIVICKSEDDMVLEYELANKNGKVFVDAELNEDSKTLDLAVQESALYDLRLHIKKENATKSITSSCVSVLVGFK